MHFALFTEVGAGIVSTGIIPTSFPRAEACLGQGGGREGCCPCPEGGRYTNRAGREEEIAVAADKIVKPLLIPHYPPLSCSAGRCHVVTNNCHIPLVRWPQGEHEGTPHLAPARLFHPRNSPSPGQTEPFHAAASEKGLTGSVIPVLHTNDMTMKLLSPNHAGNRPHISFSCLLEPGLFPKHRELTPNTPGPVSGRAVAAWPPVGCGSGFRQVFGGSMLPSSDKKSHCSPLLLGSASSLVALQEDF